LGFVVYSLFDKLRIFCFSSSTAEEKVGFGFLILKQAPNEVLSGLKSLIEN